MTVPKGTYTSDRRETYPIGSHPVLLLSSAHQQPTNHPTMSGVVESSVVSSSLDAEKKISRRICAQFSCSRYLVDGRL